MEVDRIAEEVESLAPEQALETQVWHYADVNRIPHLPQYDEGYLSIGCQPCTGFPSDPNNPRSGRWGGTKLECGIHTFSTRAER